MIDGGDLILRLGATEGSMIFRNGGPAAEARAASGCGNRGSCRRGCGGETPEACRADLAVGRVPRRGAGTGNTMDVEDPDELHRHVFRRTAPPRCRPTATALRGPTRSTARRSTVDVGPVTLAACGPDSLSEQFLVNLTSAGTYLFVEGQLVIDLKADGGRMVFDAAQVAEPTSQARQSRRKNRVGRPTSEVLRRTRDLRARGTQPLATLLSRSPVL